MDSLVLDDEVISYSAISPNHIYRFYQYGNFQGDTFSVRIPSSLMHTLDYPDLRNTNFNDKISSIRADPITDNTSVMLSTGKYFNDVTSSKLNYFTGIYNNLDNTIIKNDNAQSLILWANTRVLLNDRQNCIGNPIYDYKITIPILLNSKHYQQKQQEKPSRDSKIPSSLLLFKLLC